MKREIEVPRGCYGKQTKITLLSRFEVYNFGL